MSSASREPAKASELRIELVGDWIVMKAETKLSP
jgi:hypothetical protein